MNQKSKKNTLVIIIIIAIIIILLLRMCHSCNQQESSSQITLKIDTTAVTVVPQQDTMALAKDQKHTVVARKNISKQESNVLSINKKISSSTKELRQDTKRLISTNATNKDTGTLPTKKDSSLSIVQDTIVAKPKDTIIAKKEKQNTNLQEQKNTLAINTHKLKQDTLTSMEHVKFIKNFFSSVIIDFEGLDKNNKMDDQLKSITHFRVFVKMATQQPLSDDFTKKIFVRISDSTTGKLITFKGLSTMMQSITLYNMQEIDYTLAQQANFNNEDKSSTIEQAFERLSTFKPKNNITVRTEVICQGVKIGEAMTRFFVDKKAN